MFNKGFIWNPGNCEYECDKTCNFGEYLDYENCKCRKKSVAPLTEECTETVEEVKLTKITLDGNENSYKCSSCTVYIVLFWIFFTINVGGIGAYFVYFHWYLKKDGTPERKSTKHIKWEKSNELTLKSNLLFLQRSN